MNRNKKCLSFINSTQPAISVNRQSSKKEERTNRELILNGQNEVILLANITCMIFVDFGNYNQYFNDGRGIIYYQRSEFHEMELGVGRL